MYIEVGLALYTLHPPLLSYANHEAKCSLQEFLGGAQGQFTAAVGLFCVCMLSCGSRGEYERSFD
jgi:hypothetical protein